MLLVTNHINTITYMYHTCTYNTTCLTIFTQKIYNGIYSISLPQYVCRDVHHDQGYWGRQDTIENGITAYHILICQYGTRIKLTSMDKPLTRVTM